MISGRYLVRGTPVLPPRTIGPRGKFFFAGDLLSDSGYRNYKANGVKNNILFSNNFRYETCPIIEILDTLPAKCLLRY
jgi:hypothetical protein